MPKQFSIVPIHAIEETFPGCFPCNCHRDKFRLASYNVSLQVKNPYGHPTIVTHVFVRCNQCGEYQNFNVEHLNIEECDVNL